MKLRFIGATTSKIEKGLSSNFQDRFLMKPTCVFAIFFVQLLQKHLTELKFWRAQLLSCWNKWPQFLGHIFLFRDWNCLLQSYYLLIPCLRLEVYMLYTIYMFYSTECPKINGQFETAGIQSVFKIITKFQKSDHY